MLNNSVVFRSYKSLNEFIIDNRYVSKDLDYKMEE